MWGWIEKAIYTLGWVLGIAAFFNAEKLRKRLNRTQDVLEEKGITNRYELFTDEKIRNIVLKHRGDKPLPEIMESFEQEMKDFTDNEKVNVNRNK